MLQYSEMIIGIAVEVSWIYCKLKRKSNIKGLSYFFSTEDTVQEQNI